MNYRQSMERLASSGARAVRVRRQHEAPMQGNIVKNDNSVPALRFRGRRVRGEIHCADALAFLRSLPAGTADLVFLDPPFNLGKHYGAISDSRPEAEYELWLHSILLESIRVLADGAALYLYHLPLWAMRVAPYLERYLQFRHWIAVSMKNGFVRGKHLYPAHYALLYFTKGQVKNFHRPKLRPAKCRKCGSLVKDYGGYRTIIEAKGINLSDIWEDISPVRHSVAKHRTANELPRTLTDRIISISGAPGLTLVDPFAGAGSAVISAAEAEMRFLACDIVRGNCSLIEKRIRSLLSSTTGKKPHGAHS